MNIEKFNTLSVEGRKILSNKGFVHASKEVDASYLLEYQCSINPGMRTDAELSDPLFFAILEKIDKEAARMGANAIVGLRVDFSTIAGYSGNGPYKSVMITAQGTAVVLDGSDEQAPNEDTKTVDFMQLRQAKIANIVNDRLDWRDLIGYADADADFMYNKYLESYNNDLERNRDIRSKYVQFSLFFRHLPYEKKMELCYTLGKNHNPQLIIDNKLFDAKKILAFAKNEQLDLAVSCLEAERETYTEADLVDMRELYSYLTNLPDVGQILEDGTFRCCCGYDGYDNSPNSVHRKDKCKDGEITCARCGSNIKGLSKEQLEAIASFGVTIQLLEKLLA